MTGGEANSIHNIGKTRKDVDNHICLFAGVNMLCEIFNRCFRHIAAPAVIFTASLVFSISASIIIILRQQVFTSLHSFSLPLLMLDSAVVNIIAPSMCAWVYSMSAEMKFKNIGNVGIFTRSLWVRKKQRALRINKIYISDSFFDRDMVRDMVLIERYDIAQSSNIAVSNW